jgi:hypothetical protein
LPQRQESGIGQVVAENINPVLLGNDNEIGRPPLEILYHGLGLVACDFLDLGPLCRIDVRTSSELLHRAG